MICLVLVKVFRFWKWLYANHAIVCITEAKKSAGKVPKFLILNGLSGFAKVLILADVLKEF